MAGEFEDFLGLPIPKGGAKDLSVPGAISSIGSDSGEPTGIPEFPGGEDLPPRPPRAIPKTPPPEALKSQEDYESWFLSTLPESERQPVAMPERTATDVAVQEQQFMEDYAKKHPVQSWLADVTKLFGGKPRTEMPVTTEALRQRHPFTASTTEGGIMRPLSAGFVPFTAPGELAGSLGWGLKEAIAKGDWSEIPKAVSESGKEMGRRFVGYGEGETSAEKAAHFVVGDNPFAQMAYSIATDPTAFTGLAEGILHGSKKAIQGMGDESIRLRNLADSVQSGKVPEWKGRLPGEVYDEAKRLRELADATDAKAALAREQFAQRRAGMDRLEKLTPGLDKFAEAKKFLREHVPGIQAIADWEGKVDLSKMTPEWWRKLGEEGNLDITQVKKLLGGKESAIPGEARAVDVTGSRPGKYPPERNLGEKPTRISEEAPPEPLTDDDWKPTPGETKRDLAQQYGEAFNRKAAAERAEAALSPSRDRITLEAKARAKGIPQHQFARLDDDQLRALVGEGPDYSEAAAVREAAERSKKAKEVRHAAATEDEEALIRRQLGVLDEEDRLAQNVLRGEEQAGLRQQLEAVDAEAKAAASAKFDRVREAARQAGLEDDEVEAALRQLEAGERYGVERQGDAARRMAGEKFDRVREGYQEAARSDAAERVARAEFERQANERMRGALQKERDARTLRDLNGPRNIDEAVQYVDRNPVDPLLEPERTPPIHVPGEGEPFQIEMLPETPRGSQAETAFQRSLEQGAPITTADLEPLTSNEVLRRAFGELPGDAPAAADELTREMLEFFQRTPGAEGRGLPSDEQVTENLMAALEGRKPKKIKGGGAPGVPGGPSSPPGATATGAAAPQNVPGGPVAAPPRAPQAPGGTAGPPGGGTPPGGAGGAGGGHPGGVPPGGIPGAGPTMDWTRLMGQKTGKVLGNFWDRFLFNWWDRFRALTKKAPKADEMARAMPAWNDVVARAFAEQVEPAFKRFAKHEKEVERFRLAGSFLDRAELALQEAARTTDAAKRSRMLDLGNWWKKEALSERARVIDRLNQIEPGLGHELTRSDDILTKFINEQGLDELVKAGGVDQAAVDRMRKAHPHYARFEVMERSEGISSPLEKADLETLEKYRKTGLGQALKDEERHLVDPIEETIQKTLQIRAAAERTKVKNALLDNYAQAYGWKRELTDAEARKLGLQPGDYVTDKTRPSVQTHSKLERWVADDTVPSGRRKETWWVDADVAEAMDNLTGKQLNVVTRGLNYVFRQAVTTLNPAFIIRNLQRDMKAAFVNAEGVYQASLLGERGALTYLKDWMGGLLDAISYEFGTSRAGGAQRVREALESGIGFGFTGTLREQGGATGRLFPPGYKKITSSPWNPLNFVERIGSTVEMAPRMAVYNRAKSLGLNNLDAALKAKMATVDFNAGGVMAKMWNQWTPFLNARIQAKRSLFNAVDKDPVGTLAKLAMAEVTPWLGMYYVSSIYFPEILAEVPEWVKRDYNVLVVGETKEKDPKTGKPKPQVLLSPKGDGGMITNTLQLAMDNMQKRDPEEWMRIGVQLLHDALSPVTFMEQGKVGLTPIVTTAIGPQATAIMEAETGTVTREGGRPLVPASLKDEPIERQAKEDTPAIYSSMSKWLKENLGSQWSPIALEHIAQGFIGPFATLNKMRQRITGAVYREQGGGAEERQRSGLEKVDEEMKTARSDIRAAMAGRDPGVAIGIASAWNLKLNEEARDMERLGFSPVEAAAFVRRYTLDVQDVARSAPEEQVRPLYRKIGVAPHEVPAAEASVSLGGPGSDFDAMLDAWIAQGQKR